MAVKVGMVSLGCSKNQVDGEIMLSLIQRDGYELCGDAEQCDVVIINTCAFIEDAKRESIENILEFCRAQASGCHQGCGCDRLSGRAVPAGAGDRDPGGRCHSGHWTQH